MKETNKPATISIVEHDNEKWVRVEALGEDFIIAPHDLDGGKSDFSFDSARERLKELGLDTFNRLRGFIIAIYIEEINETLEEAGGDKFARDWYISSELWHPVGVADYYSNLSWYFDGSSGCFSSNTRYLSIFRCRPVLAYNA